MAKVWTPQPPRALVNSSGDDATKGGPTTDLASLVHKATVVLSYQLQHWYDEMSKGRTLNPNEMRQFHMVLEGLQKLTDIEVKYAALDEEDADLTDEQLVAVAKKKR